MNASDEKYEYLMETKMPIFNGFDFFLENGAFAYFKQTLKFPQYFQMSCTCTTEVNC